ncbi:DUF3429 domain-containing protein [Chthonobacter rhizosphaerae]|uniref:DUF3429 domain-containing protein n=1 Tax=Chthonobacter rhizosphaerae TaxID=2735553 RepID=UPI0015EEA42B|nr:DUF3429 domain-containing protein [Chthonobacter rhizosphaerae]
MRSIPLPALVLGGAGLLPTVAAVLALAVGSQATAALGFSVGAIYGVTILSFLGGAWWGLAAGRAPAGSLAGWLTVSVIPSLVGTLILFFLSAGSVAVLGLAFLLSPAVDQALRRAELAPAWWMSLRVPLSVGMGVLHLAMAFLAWGTAG